MIPRAAFSRSAPAEIPFFRDFKISGQPHEIGADLPDYTKLKGLTPGEHGFHLHEKDSCGPGEKDGKPAAGIAAGGHYDPAATKAHKGPGGGGHKGDLPKLVVVTLMVFYIIFITTSTGIGAVDRRLINMARVAGAGEAVIAREIIWKSLLPFFFTGLKVALPRAVSATIVGEFLVATEGVGNYIEHSRQVSDTVGVFAGIVIAMALVLSINAVVNVLERRALAWRPVEREMEL